MQVFINLKVLDHMMSPPRKQTIAIGILPNISRSKGNQAMKFLEKSYAKYGGESIPRPFSKK